MATLQKNNTSKNATKSNGASSSDDDDDENGKRGNSNLRLPYGLCARYGIPLPPNAYPRDAWNALKGYGFYPPWTPQGKKTKQVIDWNSSGSSDDSNNQGANSGNANTQAAQTPYDPSSMPAYRSNVTYGTFTGADAQAIATKYADDYNDPDYTTARKMYIADAGDGSGYSFSQSLNYKLANDLPLTATEDWIDSYLDIGMKPIGKDAKLYRFCHQDILEQFGVQNYQSYTESQLQSMLIGKEAQTKSYTSTSYDANQSPFKPGAVQGGGREVIMNINTQKDTKGTLGEKFQTEIILDKGTRFKITGVTFTGNYATPRTSTRAIPVVQLDIEAY